MSNKQVSNSRHYREHTREQDGWTVLAPPVPPAVGGDLPPPPPYTPEAAPVVPVALLAAPRPTAGTNLPLTFDVPINSNIIGAKLASRTMSFTRDTSFAVAFLDICNMMEVDPSTACIGFKWDNERATQATHVLGNATDWENCLASGFGQQKRAKTRTVICIIKNMNEAMDTAQWAPNALLHTTTGKKRKSAARSSSPAIRTPKCTKEYRKLKANLKCSTHKDQFCFVSTVDGHHVPIDPFNVGLWAKEILLGKATVARPLENIVFKDCFMPSRKKPRIASSTSSNPCVPTIHVTVNTGGSNTSPPRCSPLATITNNIDTPTSPIRDQHSDDEICYQRVEQILQLIDDSGIFGDSAELTFPAVIFADVLHECNITHVGQVISLDADFYVREINMPSLRSRWRQWDAHRRERARCKQATQKSLN
ncbi:hypothetical protein DFH08DRAFT_820098 [Mycena albidolilacea]|uniref:Uncharacterized protein n=1 Tax=Mycena albidolilacea TaxID=1033008 RepID=A0AAD6ZD77_9AGAR|nr:hypothetical protein DFH08DRAFT_820098 [Mycena albidolilacea]